MTLNCLGQRLQRTKSENEFHHDGQLHQVKKICCIKFERSWSGNLTPLPYKQIRKGSRLVGPKKVKKNPRRLSNIEPKLVRSVGMRRDWSFEDLRQRNHEKRKGKGERLA